MATPENIRQGICMIDYIKLLKHRARTSPERIALVFKNQEYSYQEVYTKSLQFAGYLKNLGISKSDRIAILELNSPDVFFLWMGAVLNGIVAVFINWRLTSSEIEHVLDDANAKVLFYGKMFSENIASVKIKKFEIMEDIAFYQFLDEEIAFNEELVQLYTSGTTGFPKGVVITHKSLLAMVKSVQLELPAFGGKAVNLVAGPLFNIAGVGYITLGLFAGAKNILLEKFVPEDTAGAISIHQVTNAFLAPAMVMAILNLPKLEKYNFSSLINIHYGGSIMPLPLLKKAREVFHCYFTQGYGLTETSGIATLLRFDDHETALNDPKKKEILYSAGRPVSDMEIMIADDEGNELQIDEVGEILIKGNNMTNGYWLAGEKLTEDSWFASGDIGRIDRNGYLYIIDRKNDMIVSGGVNIYPTEIERHLELHPDILEVAIVGIPDEKFGERPAVFVSSKNRSLNLEDIQDFLKDKIAKFKMPVILIQMEQLPRNATGKVLRKDLRKPFWKNQDRELG